MLNYENNNEIYCKTENYKNEGSLEKLPQEENQNPSQNFRNTTFAFNKDNIKEDDMERGVEKNLNIMTMTMHPKNNMGNMCNNYFFKSFF